jgi:hypothetical protein
LHHADAPVAQLQNVERAKRGRGQEHRVADQDGRARRSRAPCRQRRHPAGAERTPDERARRWTPCKNEQPEQRYPYRRDAGTEGRLVRRWRELQAADHERTHACALEKRKR